MRPRKRSIRASNAAQPDDYGKEFLDAIIAVKTVDGVDGAIEHIARYGSQHTDAIITECEATAERFLNRVDSAIVLCQRFDAIRRWRRVRIRRRDRHRDGQNACARPGRRRAIDELQVQGARHRPDQAEVNATDEASLIWREKFRSRALDRFASIRLFASPVSGSGSWAARSTHRTPVIGLPPKPR